LIVFKKVRWKNFLSTGNVFTEILLDKSPTTLIVGENGSGKSTVLDALCFGLFGKAFRKIPRPLLVNSINQKGLMVEVEFSAGSHFYEIKRGQKKYGSSPFEIYRDGVLIDQEAHSRDYQKYLEESVLKLNHRSFTQIVILGSSSFVPFMQLSAAARREIIEDILDIKIFTNMNILLKEKQAVNKETTKDLNHSIELQHHKILSQEEYINVIKQSELQQVDRLREQVNDTNKKIEHHEENIKANMILSEQLVNSITDSDKIEKEGRKSLQVENQLENKLRIIKKEVEFYLSNDECPTCHQGIDLKHKQLHIESKQSKAAELETALQDLTKIIEINNERSIEISETQRTVNNLQMNVGVENTTINNLMTYIRETEESIKAIESSKSSVGRENKKLLSLTKKSAIIRKKQEKASKEAELYEVASVLLKDKGIKARIIKQYIPVINKLVNKYLAAMDFFVEFELDERFNETIKSRYRDKFTYDSFSEGEKMRIDLALLFTWRAIARMKNSTNTNMLILDEVFDASLDATGCEEFLKLIQDLSNNTNVFVISHKGDILQDKFNGSIRFERHKNFSRIAA
jgi:DNA repair exonuclease SbcCD ATPase subunit